MSDCEQVYIVFLSIIVILLFILTIPEREHFVGGRKPGNTPRPPRHRITMFGTRAPLFSEESAIHPIISKKSAVPKNWSMDRVRW